MSTHYDVIIAGGGIVGAACAAACAREGMRVAVVERDVIGSGATAAGMGHIVVMDDSEAQFALTRFSQKLWHELARSLPATCEYEQRGTLWIAADDEEMEEARRKHAYYRERGVQAELLSASQLASLEPNLRSGLAGALLVPEDGVVYPPAVALELARRSQNAGAAWFVGRNVVSMQHGEARLDDKTILHAPRLVNATGAWSPQMQQSIPVKKRKGHLVITDRYPDFVHHQLVELGYLKSAHALGSDSVAFNVQPRSTGQILIGSSRQYGNDDTAVDQPMLSAMLQRAALYMPAIARLQAVRVWTGFRAATPDKLPLIGPSLEDETVWLATGHEGLGITTSLGTAEIIAGGFTGREPAIDPEPYLPARYQQLRANHQDQKESPCNGEA